MRTVSYTHLDVYKRQAACFEDYPVIGYEISRGLGLTLPTQMEKGSSYGFATLKGANPELVEMFNKGLELSLIHI